MSTFEVQRSVPDALVDRDPLTAPYQRLDSFTDLESAISCARDAVGPEQHTRILAIGAEPWRVEEIWNSRDHTGEAAS